MIELVAGMFGLPKDRVAYAWRRLREEGAIITAGRGRSAPPVSALDAAHLVIATVADLPPKDTIEAWRAYSQAKAQFPDPRTNSLASLPWSFEHCGVAGLDFPALTSLPIGHTFAEALAALITAAGDGSLEVFVKSTKNTTVAIQLDSLGPMARIYAGPYKRPCAGLYFINLSNPVSVRDYVYLHSLRTFEIPTLRKIGKLIASDERGKQ